MSDDDRDDDAQMDMCKPPARTCTLQQSINELRAFEHKTGFPWAQRLLRFVDRQLYFRGAVVMAVIIAILIAVIVSMQ